jgi:hypothetical protein
MTPLEWVLLVVVIVLVVAVAGLMMSMQRRKSAQLQSRFGPEYDRVVERAPNRREAEQELSAVAEKRDALQIRELSAAAAERWRQEWRAVQARFVDAPAEAVRSADDLVTSIMRDRGYPVEDFDERASLVAADYPDVVEHYREGRAGYQRHLQTGDTDTEELRRSFVHYRALFESLVSPDAHAGQHSATDRLDEGRPAGDGVPAEQDPANPYASDVYVDRPEVQR